MKIALLQFDIAWEDKKANLDKITALLSDCPSGTDLIILPEMFNTGFSLDPARLCEKPLADTFIWMKELAAMKNSAVCGSYIVEDDGRYFNRFMFVSPDDEVHTYDKRHLFSPGGEDKNFSSGHRRIVFKYKEFRICPIVCYDLRFPVWSRNRKDYDLLINCANWPAPRREVWSVLLRARALENQCFVAGVNRTGTDGTGIQYRGDSELIGPKGETLANGETDKECLICSDIAVGELLEFRKKFPILDDGDDFVINT